MKIQIIMMKISLNKILVVIIGLLFFISVLSIPLSLGLTTTRISIIILPFIIIFQILSNKNHEINKLSVNTLIPFLTSIILFIFSLPSFLFFGGGIWSVISWIPLGLLSSFMAITIFYIEPKYDFLLQKTIVFLFFLFCIITILQIINYDVLKSEKYGVGFIIRNYFKDNALNDLNRTMNSFFVFSGIGLGLLYYNYLKGFFWKFLILISLSISLYLFLMSGSRQNLVAFLLILIIFYFKKLRISLGISLNKIIKVLFIILFFIAVITKAINKGWIDLYRLQTRFFSFFIEKQITTGDEKRIDAALRALESSFSNFGLGIGPDNFPPPEVHNGYLLYLAESGLILGGIAILFCFSLIIIIRMYCKNRSYSLSDVYWIVFLIVAIWLGNLKILFREPIFWSFLGIATGFLARKIDSLNFIDK